MKLELAVAYPTFGIVLVLLLLHTKHEPPIKGIFSFFYALFAAILTGAMSRFALKHWYVLPILGTLVVIGYRVYKVFKHSAEVASHKRAHLK